MSPSNKAARSLSTTPARCSATVSPGARIAAANSLLDRGFGRPVQQVHVDQKVSIQTQHLEALREINSEMLAASRQRQDKMIDAVAVAVDQVDEQAPTTQTPVDNVSK